VFRLVQRLRAVAESATIVVMAEAGEKRLRAVSFVAHVARGIIRDQKMRRLAMFVVLTAALALLFLGSTFLHAPLNPRERPLGFLIFWIVCGWLTFTALLLALFDLLMLKLESRRTQRALREKLQAPGSTTSTTNE
jgi:heme/copper-type cytochrome/quinol oxidase subunit 3